MSHFSAIQFRPDGLFLLDQRQLPTEETWLHCASVEETAKAIEEMCVRGAPAIGCAAAFGIVSELLNSASAKSLPWGTYHKSFRTNILRLRKTRPTAVNLFYALDLMEKKGEEIPANFDYDKYFAILRETAVKLFDDDLKTCLEIGKVGADFLDDYLSKRFPGKIKFNFVTHCNTGSLATAGFGTALGVIRELYSRGKIAKVYVDETRPYLQGARLTAFELAKEHIPYCLIADSMAAVLLRQGAIDCAIVGADRIARNGDTANKIGTYNLAVICDFHKVPFFVAAPLATFDAKIDEGSQIPIEERAAREMTHFFDKPIAPAGAVVFNPSFDVTPITLISGIVTEVGMRFC